MSATYRVRMTKGAGIMLLDEGLTAEEIFRAMAEVDRIARLDAPWADYTVEGIALTQNAWYRQKPEGSNFRTIFYISAEERQISIQAILRRDQSTYQRVYVLFKAWTGQ